MINGPEDIPKEIQKIIDKHEEESEFVEEETINLGSEEQPRNVKIGTTLSAEERTEMIKLFTEFEDVFTWSYEDMHGLDTNMVVHRLPTHPDVKPDKQNLRRPRPEWILKVKEEVKKQIDAGFLRVITYTEWLANIVPIPKKDGKVRMCIDYRNLNKASPKYDFSLPHIDILVDNAARQMMLSFMDGFSGYNQIRMA